MKVDTVITIKNDIKYLLLLESELTIDGYFLAVRLDNNGEPTNNYTVFQEVKKDGKTFIKNIKDPLVLNELLRDYRSQYEDIVQN